MLKFIHLFKNYYLGISFIGILAFLLQEVPYIIMPLMKLDSNPIMNMQNEVKWIELAQGVIGTFSMVLLMILVRNDVDCFSIVTIRQKMFLTLTVSMLLINYIGWIFYYTGHQYGWLIVVTQFAVVPLYYFFFGLWKNNYPLVAVAAIFFVIHTINGCMNFLPPK